MRLAYFWNGTGASSRTAKRAYFYKAAFYREVAECT